MYVNKKFMSLLTFLLVATMVITGCAAPGSKKSNDNVSVSDNKASDNNQEETVTLKISGQQYPYSELALKAFGEKYPNIKLKIDFSNLRVEDGSVQAALRSGDVGPDLVLMSSGPGRIGVLAQQGLILQLNDMLDKNKILDRYQKWVVDQIKAQDSQGRVFEIPEGVDVFQIYYNKEIFNKYGIKLPPATWDDFLKLCQTLKDAGIQPLTAGFKNGIGVGWLGGLLIESAAGKDRMTKVIYSDGRFDQNEIINAGKMLKELVDKGYIKGKEALAIEHNQALPSFYSGQSAMVAIPQNVLLSVATKGEDVSKYGAFVFPSTEEGRPGRPSAGLATSWVVNANLAKNKIPSIEKFLDFVSSQEYQNIAFKNGGTVIPVLAQLPDVQYPPIMQDAIDKLTNGAGYNPSVYLAGKAKDEWFASLQGIVANEVTPEEAMKKIQKALEASKSK